MHPEPLFQRAEKRPAAASRGRSRTFAPWETYPVVQADGLFSLQREPLACTRCILWQARHKRRLVRTRESFEQEGATMPAVSSSYSNQHNPYLEDGDPEANFEVATERALELADELPEVQASLLKRLSDLQLGRYGSQENQGATYSQLGFTVTGEDGQRAAYPMVQDRQSWRRVINLVMGGILLMMPSAVGEGCFRNLQTRRKARSLEMASSDKRPRDRW